RPRTGECHPWRFGESACSAQVRWVSGSRRQRPRPGSRPTWTRTRPAPWAPQRGKSEKQPQKEVEKGKLTAADHGALLERLRWTTHMHDLADVDLVIESIVEELPVQREHFA